MVLVLLHLVLGPALLSLEGYSSAGSRLSRPYVVVADTGLRGFPSPLVLNDPVRFHARAVNRLILAQGMVLILHRIVLDPHSVLDLLGIDVLDLGLVHAANRLLQGFKVRLVFRV